MKICSGRCAAVAEFRRRDQLRVSRPSREHGVRRTDLLGGAGRPPGDAMVPEFLPQAPLELCPFLGLKTVPSTDPFPRKFGKEDLRPDLLLQRAAGGSGSGGQALRQELPPPILDWMGPMPFPALQSLFDPLLPKGLPVVLEGRLRQGTV